MMLLSCLIAKVVFVQPACELKLLRQLEIVMSVLTFKSFSVHV